jgi:hypothetical protein
MQGACRLVRVANRGKELQPDQIWNPHGKGAGRAIVFLWGDRVSLIDNEFKISWLLGLYVNKGSLLIIAIHK